MNAGAALHASTAGSVGFARLLSDDRLVQRAAAGDERAFAAIFERHHQNLYRFCLAIVGNPEDAQDALQNTMASVLRALPGEERQIDLKPWLYRIAHNEAINLLRRRRETHTLDAELPAPGPGLAEDVAVREQLRRLIADMEELPQRQRQVLVMRELSGLGFGEIGAALGTSDAVARQTLYEARRSLQQMEAGREMSCEAVTRALSDGDGRVVRRRDVRAHLRTCESCRRFEQGIKSRQREFAAISPLPAAAAAGVLHGLLGGPGNGGGLVAALGGGAAKSLGASTALKGAATIAAVAAIGVGAAQHEGVIHLGGGDGAPAAKRGGRPAPLPAAAAERRFGLRYGATGARANGQGDPRSKANALHLRTAVAGGAVAAETSHDLAKGDAAAGEDVKANAGGGTDASAAAHEAHPRGPGHAKQHPAAAKHGQETAASHKAAGGESGERPEAHSEHPEHPERPETPEHAEPPESSEPPGRPEQPDYSDSGEPAAANGGGAREGADPEAG